MVKETTTLGDGRRAESFRPQDVRVPNIVVYESTRQVENWELAYVSEKIEANPTGHWRIRPMMEEIFGKRELEFREDRDKLLKAEVLYPGFLKFRRKQQHGLFQISHLAVILRDCGYRDIAETLQP